MITTVLQHIPTWVFFVLFGLIALGVTQALPRSMTLRRSTVLPLVLVGYSLTGVVSSFGDQPLALPAWALGLAVSVAALYGRIDISKVHYSATTRRFQLPGSWLPLVVMLGLFVVKFGAGFTLAMQPELHQFLPFALSASTVYGLFSGIFLARAMALWQLARQATLQLA